MAARRAVHNRSRCVREMTTHDERQEGIPAAIAEARYAVRAKLRYVIPWWAISGRKVLGTLLRHDFSAPQVCIDPPAHPL
jgi:hypothetical protein